MGDAGEPRQLHKSLPVIRRDAGVQLRKTTDENREACDKLEVAHGEHSLFELFMQPGGMGTTLHE